MHVTVTILLYSSRPRDKEHMRSFRNLGIERRTLSYLSRRESNDTVLARSSIGSCEHKQCSLYSDQVLSHHLCPCRKTSLVWFCQFLLEVRISWGQTSARYWLACRDFVYWRPEPSCWPTHNVVIRPSVSRSLQLPPARLSSQNEVDGHNARS